MNRSRRAILAILLGVLWSMLLSFGLPRILGASGLAIGWQTETSLPSPLSGGLGLVAMSQRLITIGGQDLSLALGSPVTSVLGNQIDPWGDVSVWDQIGNAPLSAPRALHASVRYASAAGDRACVIGGWSGSAALKSVQCAAVDTVGHVDGPWQTEPDLPGPRQNLGAVVSKHLIYVAGGWDGSKVRGEVYVTTVSEDGSLTQWRPVRLLPVSLFALTLSASGDYLYAVGGHDGSVARGEVYRAHILDDQGTLDGWTRLSSNDLPAARERHAAVVYREHLLVIGGRDPSGVSTNSVYAAAIKADGSLGAWAADFLPAMPEALDRHAAVVVDVPYCGEVIYVAGGRSGNDYRNGVYRTDCPLTDPWIAWESTDELLVCPGTRVSILYGNQTGARALVATLTDPGPAVFTDEGEECTNSGYKSECTLPQTYGVYGLTLKPASGSTVGQGSILHVEVDGSAIEPDLSVKVAQCISLPLILKNAP